MSTFIRPIRLGALALLAASMFFVAPVVMAGGFGYTLSLFGPGYGVSYSGCGHCRGGGWVSAYAGSGWGWAPYGGYVNPAPAYSYYSAYGDDDYEDGTVVYSSPYMVYQGYRGWRYRGWYGGGDWRYRGWHRDRDWRYRSWRGDHDGYRGHGWHREDGDAGYQRGGWNRHDGGYWGHRRNGRDADHGWRRDRGDSGRWGGGHHNRRGPGGDRDGHR